MLVLSFDDNNGKSKKYIVTGKFWFFDWRGGKLMVTFEKFERLVASSIPQKSIQLHFIGANGESLTAWLSSLSRLDKHEQYAQVETVLSELIVSSIDDAKRYAILEQCNQAIERLIALMHADYIHSSQNTSPEQKACLDEVRSLYFLVILAYQGIAYRTLDILNQEASAGVSAVAQKTGWLSKFTANLSGNVVRNGVNIDVVNEPKRLFTLSVFRMMSSYYKLIMEFALAYQRTPSLLWGQMNAWYLKAVGQSVERTVASKLSANAQSCCIHVQYIQSCVASFSNLFAYRRSDIINIFKILPSWVQYVDTTFTPDSHLKVFVNLKGSTPPELVGPHASVNPFAEGSMCLFMRFVRLFEHLNSLKNTAQKSTTQHMFEFRLANLVLVAFDRNTSDKNTPKDVQKPSVAHEALMLVGYNAIYNEIADDKSFNQIIGQNSLSDMHKAKQIPNSQKSTPQTVQLLTRSETGSRFVFGKHEDSTSTHDVSTKPILQAFGLFAMKSALSQNKHPWRIGIIHWAETKDNKILADGRFLGRLLTACGVRLSSNDMRSQDFIQGLLVAGDGLNQQTTLVMPKYHFRAGDTIVLKVSEKQTTLRLEKNLLSTDDFEQYEIVRLV